MSLWHAYAAGIRDEAERASEGMGSGRCLECERRLTIRNHRHLSTRCDACTDGVVPEPEPIKVPFRHDSPGYWVIRQNAAPLGPLVAWSSALMAVHDGDRVVGPCTRAELEEKAHV